jgi:hypothetical protein
MRLHAAYGAVNGHACYRPPSNLDDAIRFLSIHCMRAVSAADSEVQDGPYDGHHRAAAEQEHVSSCPAPSSSTMAPQAAIEQLLLEVGNLRHDMQELKAAAARPAPGTIVGSTWGKTTFRTCPEGSKSSRTSFRREILLLSLHRRRRLGVIFRGCSCRHCRRRRRRRVFFYCRRGRFVNSLLLRLRPVSARLIKRDNGV